jgi:hypothetical protein
MNVEVFYCVRDAVTLAKKYQIKTVSKLREELEALGWKAETINLAIDEWANYEVSKCSVN